MHLWPVSPPQRFNIPDRETERENLDNDTDILATIPLPHSNVVIMITATRALVYNFKPFALVAAHERTKESLEELGYNKRLVPSIAFKDRVKGVSDNKPPSYMSWYQGKLVFYLITDKNYALAYQVLRNSTSESIFKDYGIPIINVSQINEFESAAYDANLDDDTLTVFDKNKSSKVIQNGFILNKEKGILQFLSSKDEDINELPVKKLELRLKVVFKFEFDIVDFLGFKQFINDNDRKYEESILVLFPDKVQLLRLVDFKFNSATLVDITDGKKMCTCNGKFYVISQDPINFHCTIYQVNLEEKTIEFQLTKEIADTFVNVITMSTKIILVAKNSLHYFCTEREEFIFEKKLQYNIKLCKSLSDSCFIIISEANNVYFFSKFGNKLFSSISDDDLSPTAKTDDINFSDLMYIDKTLVITSHSGEYHIWHLWLEYQQSNFDYRVPKVSVVANNNNDIQFYSSSGDSPLNRTMLQTIKLPTKSLNNSISQIKINTNLKMVAINISNKSTLLIQNLETNLWYQFNDCDIIDMNWIASNYLVCFMKEYNSDTFLLKCFNIPLQKLDNFELDDIVTWEYEIPETMEITNFFVNTHYKYKYLKMKNRELEESELPSSERYFKTAEIFLVTNSEILVFDVISRVLQMGFNTIVNVHKYTTLKIPEAICSKGIQWITSLKDGYLFHSADMIYKVAKLSDGTFQSTQLIKNVDKLIDVVKQDIFLVQEDQFIIYNLGNLWDEQDPTLSFPVDEDNYPVCISADAAILQSQTCIFNSCFSKLIVKNTSHLDKLIQKKIEAGVELEEISHQYSSLRHYKFALEKILSLKLMEGQPIDRVLDLIMLLNEKPLSHGKISRYSDMLEIVSNCLRKSEMRNWKTLFDGLKLSPRELLAICIEHEEAKMLGVLLLVFLNFGEGDVLENIQEEESDTAEFQNATMDDVLKDEELMLNVCRLLVNSAAKETNYSRATEAWDLCLQLLRLLKALDKENNTDLLAKASVILAK
ncbi:Guanine nucleotide exchange factor subunit RIC1 [Nakaseomyces bracarensis]|uniref:Guanine nucleotide exchange factor subunit RIC1 n=1 Tax=Nakaseomyces bracarensis TaxID=273131 RepID=A0ABR4NVA9_9SACH